MGVTVHCNKGFNGQYFPQNLNTDICSISAFKWQFTVFVSAVLLAVGIYILRKWKYRCHKTLLTFHNLRAAVALLLLAINSLELARALLPMESATARRARKAALAVNGGHGTLDAGNESGYSGSESNFAYPTTSNQQQPLHHEQEDYVVVVIGITQLWNALAAILFTIMLMWYHRIVELKKPVAFLYVCVTAEISVFFVRIYELAEVFYFENFTALEPVVQGATAVCLLGLGALDAFSIYKERYRPDYLEDFEKIGYKHTLATFYSKICFWWLMPLLCFGYKEPLELEDLGQMRLEDSARAYYDRFLLIYKTAKVKNANRSPSLWLCYVKASWRMFTLGGVLKLFGDLFALIGPLAIQQIVQYVEHMYANVGNSANNNGHYNNTPNAAHHIRERAPITAATTKVTNWFLLHSVAAAAAARSAPHADDNQIADIAAASVVSNNGIEVKIYYPTWLDLLSNGWAIAWIVLLAALTQGALSQASTHILNMTGIRIKTSLQGLIYRKTLLLNSSCIESDERTAADADGSVGDKKDKTVDGNARENNSEMVKGEDDCRRENHKNGLSDVGAITNLMAEDTLNIMSLFWIAHYVWAIPLKIAVVMYLLYLKLGISAVIGSFVCILTMTPLQFLIGKAMSNNTDIMAKYTDERLQKLHDTFAGIKLIKLNAWDDVFLRKIAGAREKELKYLNKDSVYWTLMTILTHISSVLISFVTLAVYVRIESKEINDANDITASRMFSALALFQQLTVPLLIFPITVPIIISAVVSTRRLERFLGAREIQKQFEGIRHMARIWSKSDASLDMYEVRDKVKQAENSALAAPPPTQEQQQIRKENKLNERLALTIIVPDQPAPLAQSEPITPLLGPDCNGQVCQNNEVRKEKLPNCNCAEQCVRKVLETKEGGVAKRASLQRKELSRKSSYVAQRPHKLQNAAKTLPQGKKLDSWHRDSLVLKMPEDTVVSVQAGRFAWNPQRHELSLHIDDLAIPKAKLTVIVGKNGSGKTSLLSALLTEMPLISGDIIWNKTSTIAFVPQQPWLLNASIRENILFGEQFRPTRYDFVLEACALKPDIELMPAADLTVIGERGINLSGGQRHRVALARALYSSANVVIMDDPLSSLDNEVARHIFEQSIKRMLLKTNRTVILVTQQLHLVQQADYLIVMKDGRLQASGSYKEIEVKHPHIIVKWNAVIAKANEEQQNASALGRTARERWKLFKNVSKLGLQRSISITSTSGGAGEGGSDAVDAEMEIAAMIGENDDVMSASFASTSFSCGAKAANSKFGSNFTFTRKRSSIYGSRHLFYDAPLPIDECQTEDVIMRRRRRGSTQRRPNSCASSSRLSGISTVSSNSFRRSFFTSSYSSTASCASNNSSYATDSEAGLTAQLPCYTNTNTSNSREMRVQSWQPQSSDAAAASKLLHQPVARNISSPGSLITTATQKQQQQQQQQHQLLASSASLMADDAALVAGVMQSNVSSTAKVSTTSKPDGGFQQFLRRMSMRRSNKPTAIHRPVSVTNSILSITEEATTPTSPTPANPSLPSIQLSTSTSPDTETDSWLAHIENEECVVDANMDYKALTAAAAVTVNRASVTGAVTNVGAASVPPSGISAVILNAGSALTIPPQQEQEQQQVHNDIERKYGKIPAQIYLLYLRASGLPIVLIFFTTALIWQSLRVYTDVWLQQWTDHNAATAAAAEANSSYSGASAAIAAQQQHEVTYYFHIYAVISCVCIVMAMISTPAGQMAGCNARRNLHDKLLHTIMRKSLHFFQVTPLGRIMNRFSNDMAIIDKKIAATSQRLLQFTLLCLCAVLINVSITPWFIPLTLPICGAYYAIQKFYRCSSRELQRIDNSTNSPVISHLAETIQGVTTIRAYNQESRFTEILFRRLEANTIAFTILNTSNRWLGISLDYLGGVIVFVAIVTALLAATISCSQQQQARDFDNIKNERNMSDVAVPAPTPSLVGLAINYTLLVPIYLNWVVKLLADMEMYVGSVERIAYYAEDEDREEVAAVAAETTKPAIIVNDINVGAAEQTYHGAADSDQAEVTATAVGQVDDIVVGGRDDAAAKLHYTTAAINGNTSAQQLMHAGDDDDDEHTKFMAISAARQQQQQQHSDAERRASEARRMSTGKRYKTVPISWPQRGDISFENVSLRYEGASVDVIKNLTLKIPAGQRIGICGRTGSGKSSLALSLFGVLRTTSGCIRIDDVDIAQIHPDEIRTRLSIIPQDVHLFNATIRENLDPPGYYSDLALWNCLEMAQLKEFVNGQLPQGLDTEIMDGGFNLSAGYRQLFCLARAILRGSVCLVLDEATSSLDSTTERALLSAAHQAFRGRTILTIAHRLATILDYDRIIVLENGKIVEDGNPQLLQHQADGVFRALLHSGRPMSAAE